MHEVAPRRELTHASVWGQYIDVKQFGVDRMCHDCLMSVFCFVSKSFLSPDGSLLSDLVEDVCF